MDKWLQIATQFYTKNNGCTKKEPSIDHYASFNTTVQNLIEKAYCINLYIFLK